MNTLGGLAVFCLVYLLATASPGPGIAAIVARVLSHGTHRIPGFIAGFVVGDLVWFTLAATGMAMLAQSAHLLFLVLKYAGAAYLLYLAYRLWTSPVQRLAETAQDLARPQSNSLFLAGIALTLGNPKVMVFFLALWPTVIDLKHMSVAQYLRVAIAICVILSAVLTGYTLAAVRARRFFKSARSLRWLNRTSGVVMGGAAVAVASR